MAEGQFTGTRSQYVYTSDSGADFILTLDDTNAQITGTGLVAFDPANPGTATPAPRRFTPRAIYWQGTLSGRQVRKRLVCGTTAAALYATGVSTALQIGDAMGATTGRVGEQLTF